MFDFITFTLREGAVIFIGLFIAWNLPQPQWAKDLQAKVVAKYNELKAKFSK